jgi:hypothetical protein
MKSENKTAFPPLHTLIPLEDFKAVLGIDDRDDKLLCCFRGDKYIIETINKKSIN